MSISLTILGKSPSWQDADGACSGYLVESGGQRLLLDCGSGVFAKLRAHGGYEQVDAVLISHLHADHILDLVPFAYALTYGPHRPEDPLPLHAPPGTREALRRLCGAWGSENLIERAFAVVEYDPAAELALADLRVSFAPVPHYVPSFAIRLRAPDGRSLAFSADCGPNEALIELVRGADLLLIEATLREPDLEDHAHLTAAQAGEIGARAGAQRLLLTHFSDQLDAAEVRATAAEAFGGAVELAVEGARHDV